VALTHDSLNQFTGTRQWFRHPLYRKFLYTEGVQFVARNGEAYWLIEAIFSHQGNPKVNQEPFQVWKLTVDEELRTAVLVCEDGNDNELLQQVIPFTDFPLSEIRFFLEDGVLLLPSEH
jgi:hypothetical protein